jgi:hypothetical protein
VANRPGTGAQLAHRGERAAAGSGADAPEAGRRQRGSRSGGRSAGLGPRELGARERLGQLAGREQGAAQARGRQASGAAAALQAEAAHRRGWLGVGPSGGRRSARASRRWRTGDCSVAQAGVATAAGKVDPGARAAAARGERLRRGVVAQHKRAVGAEAGRAGSAGA